MKRRLAEAALAGNTIVWGATFVLVKAALANVSPVLFLTLRFSLASLALLVLFPAVWMNRHKERPALLGGALAGLFLFAGYFFQTVGLQYTTAPKSAFLTGLASVMVPLLAALVYRVRPVASELLGVAVATGGLALMTLQGPVGSIGRGDWLTLACAVAFAGHIVTLGHYSERLNFQVLSVAQVGAAAGLALALFWWVEPVRLVWRPGVVYAILVTGLFATALAFTIQAWAQRHTSSTRTALIYTLEPVVAWLTSYFIVGEGLAGRTAAGAILILGGVILVEVKPLETRLHPFR